jgi:hypothetical protein
MAEPLPTRDNRQSILLFEAAEGGAGVLTRLATEPDALAAVAAKALEVMHFKAPRGPSLAARQLVEELDHDGKPIARPAATAACCRTTTSPTTRSSTARTRRVACCWTSSVG